MSTTVRLKDKTAILRERRFATFFAGNVVSKIGDAAVPVAFALAAYQVSGSAAGITWVLLSLWGARFFMVATGGRVADRYDRIKVMMGADVLRLVAQGALALLFAGLLPVQSWHLCLSAAVYGIGTAFYVPAQIGLTPELVPEERLQDANGLLSLVADVAFLLGPVLAGVLMSTVGFTWVLWLDVASFAVNLVLLLRLSRLHTPARRARTDAPADADADADADTENEDTRFRAGLAVMARYPWFGFGMALWFLVSLGIGLTAVAGPVIAVDSLGGAGAWSVLATCLAVGSLLGSLTVISASKQHPWKAAAVVVTLGAVLQFTTLTLRDHLPTAVIAASFVLCALTTAACGIVWDTAYQSEIPERYLSRVGSVDNFVNAVGVPLGMLVGGLFTDHYDVVFLVLSLLLVLLGLPAARLAGRRRKATP
ncbi:MFS transporter [Streptomyces antarcticus]|uniref:MFS transporter n=1 Tax=Streptomyces antarcticus TaxID=2996458 RepID=UPI002270C880|nr:MULTISPECIES: MFS transporter [unclassified Streptomyces]MCY0942983.1 MFS transporter [Streptomyces sp. H34-AA3]MCZ4083057.1 MFS transporter [Streptomyces sp. H34-S5]